MIRRLTERDRDTVCALLGLNPVHNLYQLSNIEQVGFDADFCEFWGSCVDDGDERVVGVLNRYMSGWSVYGLPEADWQGLARVLDEYPEMCARLQDNPGGVASLLPLLAKYDAERVVEEELMALARVDFAPYPVPDGCEVRRASLVDLDELAAFYADAGSMSRSQGAVERPLRDLRVWVATVQGRIRSAALTNAEVAESAMVGGVFTPVASRGQGLAHAVCSGLCAELLQEGKEPVLYWQTAAAGAMYRRLGFRRIGVWRSVWLRRL